MVFYQVIPQADMSGVLVREETEVPEGNPGVSLRSTETQLAYNDQRGGRSGRWPPRQPDALRNTARIQIQEVESRRAKRILQRSSGQYLDIAGYTRLLVHFTQTHNDTITYILFKPLAFERVTFLRRITWPTASRALHSKLLPNVERAETFIVKVWPFCAISG